ncbi:MAG: hypothetical protein U9N45_00585 [Gemmatimonadota bacterium]|nr:hypothetical protein [Gemmatimonadota bacterium]
MRVLPYFQTTMPSRPAQAAARSHEPAGPGKLNREKIALTRPADTDVFIPSSPVTGVVHSIRARGRIAGHASSIVKSGSYGFYKLDGRLDGAPSSQKGMKLDLRT